jgi:hypothetical protein
VVIGHLKATLVRLVDVFERLELKETKRYPRAKPEPAVDRATADWQALDLTNALTARNTR